MTRTVLALMLCLFCAAFAQTHSDDEYEAAYAFMNRINFKAMLERGKKQAIEAQIIVMSMYLSEWLIILLQWQSYVFFLAFPSV